MPGAVGPGASAATRPFAFSSAALLPVTASPYFMHVAGPVQLTDEMGEFALEGSLFVVDPEALGGVGVDESQDVGVENGSPNLGGSTLELFHLVPHGEHAPCVAKASAGAAPGIPPTARAPPRPRSVPGEPTATMLSKR